jgi:hypothetical protein
MRCFPRALLDSSAVVTAVGALHGVEASGGFLDRSGVGVDVQVDVLPPLLLEPAPLGERREQSAEPGDALAASPGAGDM